MKQGVTASVESCRQSGRGKRHLKTKEEEEQTQRRKSWGKQRGGDSVQIGGWTELVVEGELGGSWERRRERHGDKRAAGWQCLHVQRGLRRIQPLKCDTAGDSRRFSAKKSLSRATRPVIVGGALCCDAWTPVDRLYGVAEGLILLVVAEVVDETREGSRAKGRRPGPPTACWEKELEPGAELEGGAEAGLAVSEYVKTTAVSSSSSSGGSKACRVKLALWTLQLWHIAVAVFRVDIKEPELRMLQDFPGIRVSTVVTARSQPCKTASHGASQSWLSVFVNPQLALLQQQTDQSIM
ncbi:unnamed protein product [Pleuronectes platessa]|uniref:Uncharacterized protein n=1 Tax=Pleuronectes platessa TaxID=8262 RepID=A0A9N7TNT8_PLEPL|nr:unnamed protein product [Pleuronectes platessa]